VIVPFVADSRQFTGMRYNYTARLFLGGKQTAWSGVRSLYSVSVVIISKYL